MTAINATASVAATWQGALQILRYNRGMYAVAAAATAGGAIAASLLPLPRILQSALVLMLLCTFFWSACSLWVSHLVYDKTLPNRWKRLVALGPDSTRHWVQLHAGVDETHGALHRLLPGGRGIVLDIFDPVEMTEPSIRRARALQNGPAARRADYRALSLPADGVDAVYLVFAAHELRRPEARSRFFSELSRVLRTGGRIILLEHCRGLANALAFGPGVLHFFSRREWLRVGRQSGLRFVARTPVTSFADAFVWEKES